MKLIIAGGRNFSDYELLKKACDEFKDVEQVVSGCARGADTWGVVWARENKIPIAPFPADWKRHGIRAGMLRNQLMAHYGDALLAFWDGKSRGTQHMIDCAHRVGIPVTIVRY